MAEQNNQKPAKKKNQGPIRVGAIIPTLVIMALIYLYVYLFFDSHLKSALEWVGYKAYGAEINIDEIKTSFWDANLSIRRIQLTDHDEPVKNAIEIAEIRSGLLWDALLRGKIVITEATIENIQMGTPRKYPGKVAPPSPDGGFISREAERLKAKALASAQEDYNQNILGDIAAIMGGVSVEEQLKKIESELKGVVKTKEVEKAFKEKQAEWKTRLKELPTVKQIQDTAKKLEDVKTSGFKNVKEVETSIKEIDSVFKDLEAKKKLIDTTQKNLGVDLKTFEQEIALIEKYIRDDINDLQKRFNIPNLDTEAISKSLFMEYLSPILARASEYKDLAEKYMPPNLKPGAKKDEDTVIQAHPRATGTTYSFGRPNSYPLFWLKKASISSNAAYSPLGGDLKGEIIDITSDQHSLGRPTKMTIAGDFPTHKIHGINANAELDLREGISTAFDFSVGSYPIGRNQLSDSKEVRLAFVDALGAMTFKGGWKSKSGFEFALANTFDSVSWEVESKQREVQSILNDVLNGISRVTLQASGGGDFPKIRLNVRSNLGPEIGKGFQRVLSARISEARMKLEQHVRGQIDAEKEKLEAQFNELKSQFEGELNKVKAQVAKLESQAKEEKKKAENQVRSQLNAEKKKAEDKLKKELEKKGAKKLEDLKKGFGL